MKKRTTATAALPPERPEKAGELAGLLGKQICVTWSVTASRDTGVGSQQTKLQSSGILEAVTERYLRLKMAPAKATLALAFHPRILIPLGFLIRVLDANELRVPTQGVGDAAAAPAPAPIESTEEAPPPAPFRGTDALTVPLMDTVPSQPAVKLLAAIYAFAEAAIEKGLTQFVTGEEGEIDRNAATHYKNLLFGRPSSTKPIGDLAEWQEALSRLTPEGREAAAKTDEDEPLFEEVDRDD